MAFRSSSSSSEYQHVVATGSNGADLVIFMREHNCFENGYVWVSDGHEVIVRPGPSGSQSWVVQAGYRTIPTITLSLRYQFTAANIAPQYGWPLWQTGVLRQTNASLSRYTA